METRAGQTIQIIQQYDDYRGERFRPIWRVSFYVSAGDLHLHLWCEICNKTLTLSEIWDTHQTLYYRYRDLCWDLPCDVLAMEFSSEKGIWIERSVSKARTCACMVCALRCCLMAEPQVLSADHRFKSQQCLNIIHDWLYLMWRMAEGCSDLAPHTRFTEQYHWPEIKLLICLLWV